MRLSFDCTCCGTPLVFDVVAHPRVCPVCQQQFTIRARVTPLEAPRRRCDTCGGFGEVHDVSTISMFSAQAWNWKPCVECGGLGFTWSGKAGD